MRSGLATAILLGWTLWAFAGGAVAQQVNAPSSHERLRQETALAVRSKLSPLLTQYCREACLIIDVKVDVEEQLNESDDLGFEGVTGDNLGAHLFVSKIAVDIQVDDRVTSVNRDRLLTILKNNLQHVTALVDVVWRPVTVPQIGQSAAKEELLKRQLQQRVTAAIDKVIETYCPEQCVVSQIAVDGKLVTPDEAADLTPEEIVRDKSGQAILKVDTVDAEVSIDASLPGETRQKIVNLMKAKTKFVAGLNLDVQVTAFPESFLRQRERDQKTADDPFGLERLRQTLRMFRELASTKEIITTTTNNSRSTETSENRTSASTKESSAETASTTANSTNSQNSSSNSNSTDATAGLSPTTWALVVGGLMLLAGVIIALIMKMSAAGRDARMMMAALPQARQAAGAGSDDAGGAVRGGHGGVGGVGGFGGFGAEQAPRTLMSDSQRRELAIKMKNAEIRDELVKCFLDTPRVAKETFSRLLQEEGVEATARYVHIFGQLVIFELLDDPNLQRDLYELSEYYHKSDFIFSPDDEHKLLSALKTRVTANEIRLMTRKQMDKFDFLAKLDATQVFNLISEEKPQVQSIVLTQLDHKRRRDVFDMYHGDAKVELMRELCRANAIPKDYLGNVAKALFKKVSDRPEFDTENLRSSDILLDLLEKAELSEQRALMQNLMQTNIEAARAIKLKLVTVEILAYLKDGHLLEIMLGIEREDLLAFLAGTRDHIRNLILTKAPEELADSWLEDLNNARRLDEQNYRLVEMKLLGRVRSLASNGVINLLDLNDMIFGKSASELRAAASVAAEPDAASSPNAMVA